ncbi:hypothetical protein [Castellaniella sp.]|uniref:hypothetical protein n=1 Tax=Castellaniella sp. TaxID=1955812 RepID=UPI002AFE1E77|nr:hypothetical protein [Castellaniella sp.]
MTQAKELVRVKEITFTFKEGLTYTCNALPLTVRSWAQANALLHTWSDTAPKNGGYDKVDFSVTWSDASEPAYKGRYDLKHWECPGEQCDLAAHVREYLEFYAGIAHPAHLTEEQYRKHVGDGDPAAKDMLDTLSFED